MAGQEIRYQLDGDAFTGMYEVMGSGESTEVSVRFGGSSISAVAGQLGTEVVARTLLGELVREKLALTKKWPDSRDRSHSGVEVRGAHYRYGHETTSSARR